MISGNPPSTANTFLGNVDLLSDMAVVSFSGVDAISFLQGQLTNDLAGAAANGATLAGYCTAQGRLLGTGIFLVTVGAADTTTEVIALMRRDIAQSIVKRLSMFVLRAKLKISLTDRAVYGVTALAHADTEIDALVGSAIPKRTYEWVETKLGHWIAAPSADANTRRWWLVAQDTSAQDTSALGAQFVAAGLSDWHLGDMKAGLPWIESATQDLFIPQTLNLDLIHGVSFSKGCYPGQEIVARTHYRGTLKRRMGFACIVLNKSELTILTIKPGDDIIDTTHESQICGRVINVATTTEGVYFLFEASLSALQSAQLKLANHPELPIQLLNIPNSITEPIA